MLSGGVSWWPEGNIVSLMEMLVTAPGTELATLLCFGCLESPPPSGGSTCPVYKGWVGKSELFNFKCYNKSKCSRDQGNEHLEHKLEVLCQDCWSSHPASGPLGNGIEGCCVTEFWTLSSRMDTPGLLMPQIWQLTLTCKFSICYCLLWSHKV